MERSKPKRTTITPTLRREIIRIVDDRIREAHVTREDFSELKEIMRGIGVTMGELAEAQQRTELRVEELAEAQKETQRELRELGREQCETRRQLGGLAMAVGYGIEDRIIPYVADFGKVEYGIEVESVDWKYLVYQNGNSDEVNIFARGTKEGRTVYLLGKFQAQPVRKDIASFHRLAERVKATLDGELFLFLVGYLFDPETEQEAGEHYPHIRLMKTYQFELSYRKQVVKG